MRFCILNSPDVKPFPGPVIKISFLAILFIIDEARDHKGLKQKRQYFGLPLDDLDEVKKKCAEFLARIKDRMKKGTPPEKDFTVRI
ncbi:MAG: hypothetical protein LUQ09_05035 [Methanomassiliicoccales archaeon]|nr:hypothetical protein [Methanomassiliicoccales archaeon]